MRRVTGAVLFGLGLVCVVAAAALAWVVVPSQKRVPFDLKPPDVVVTDPDATFLMAQTLPGGKPDLSIERGALQSTTGIKPDFKAAAGLTGKLAGKTLIWNVYQATVTVDSHLPVSLSESHIALDRVSGAAVSWGGQCYNDVKDAPNKSHCVPGNIAFGGQLYLFPFDTQKKTYQYWDGTLRTALPMVYRGEQKISGLPTYRFEQVVPQQDLPVDQKTVTGLLGFLAPKAHTATMTYQDTRTLWVEPMTGAIVAYREEQQRELVPDTGPPLDLLKATFQYEPATAKTIVGQARDGRSQLLLLGRYLPIGLPVAGVLLALLGLLITRRVTASGAHVADRVSESDPTPVRQA
jgi:Porin PorA